jgi:hypothetical protein
METRIDGLQHRSSSRQLAVGTENRKVDRFSVALRSSIAFQLRGLDSNQRPPGYEPDELPLLYPATALTSRDCIIPTGASQGGRRTGGRRTGGRRIASWIKENFPAVQVHQPADPVIRLANCQPGPHPAGNFIG